MKTHHEDEGAARRSSVTHLRGEGHVSKHPAKHTLQEQPQAGAPEPDETPPQRCDCELVEDPGPEEEPDGYGWGV
jgi:hypothetical protein